jgi:hypothetical protein
MASRLNRQSWTFETSCTFMEIMGMDVSTECFRVRTLRGFPETLRGFPTPDEFQASVSGMNPNRFGELCPVQSTVRTAPAVKTRRPGCSSMMFAARSLAPHQRGAVSAPSTQPRSTISRVLCAPQSTSSVEGDVQGWAQPVGSPVPEFPSQFRARPGHANRPNISLGTNTAWRHSLRKQAPFQASGSISM